MQKQSEGLNQHTISIVLHLYCSFTDYLVNPSVVYKAVSVAELSTVCLEQYIVEC